MGVLILVDFPANFLAAVFPGILGASLAAGIILATGRPRDERNASHGRADHGPRITGRNADSDRRTLTRQAAPRRR